MAALMTTRQVAGLMAFAATTLVIAATAHLSGSVNDGSRPFRPDRAGIAEAIIAVVLAVGVFALLRGRRRVAIGTLVFAIGGFCVGLSMTIRGGAIGDVAYHATMLPILLLTLAGAIRLKRT
jgi:hypothetical protein